jgi:hypothetical protein
MKEIVEKYRALVCGLLVAIMVWVVLGIRHDVSVIKERVVRQGRAKQTVERVKREKAVRSIKRDTVRHPANKVRSAGDKRQKGPR